MTYLIVSPQFNSPRLAGRDNRVVPSPNSSDDVLPFFVFVLSEVDRLYEALLGDVEDAHRPVPQREEQLTLRVPVPGKAGDLVILAQLSACRDGGGARVKVFDDVGLGIDVDALEDAGLRPHEDVEVDRGRRHCDVIRFKMNYDFKLSQIVVIFALKIPCHVTKTSKQCRIKRAKF